MSLSNTQIVEWDGLYFDVSMVSPAVQDRVRRRRYEGQSIDRIRTLCPAGIPFVNFGAGMGVVDCLHNVRMTEPERHIAVEGNPENVAISEMNRLRNGCKYRTINKAISYGGDVKFFVPDQKTELMMAGSVDDRFEAAGMKGRWVTVGATSLGAILRDTGWTRIALVVDIEGAEYALVENEIDLITEACDWLLVEWHYPNDKTHPDARKATLAKRALKSRMQFDEANSKSRMSVFKRKPRSVFGFLSSLRRKLPALS